MTENDSSTASFKTPSRNAFVKASSLIAGVIDPTKKKNFIIHIYGGENNGKSLIADAIVDFWKSRKFNYAVAPSRKMQLENFSGEGAWENVRGTIPYKDSGVNVDIVFMAKKEQLEAMGRDDLPHITFVSNYKRIGDLQCDVEICITQTLSSDLEQLRRLFKHHWVVKFNGDFSPEASGMLNHLRDVGCRQRQRGLII